MRSAYFGCRALDMKRTRAKLETQRLETLLRVDVDETTMRTSQLRLRQLLQSV